MNAPVEFGGPSRRPRRIFRPFDALEQLGSKREPIIRRKLECALQEL